MQARNTIKERMLEIQKRKTAIANGALRGQGADSRDVLENFRIMFEDF